MLADSLSRLFCTRKVASSCLRLKRYASSASESEAAENRIDDETRFSPIGIQMLSSELHRQIFGGNIPQLEKDSVFRSIEHLKEHQLWGHKTPSLSDVNFKLPKLLGSDLEQHFWNLGDRYGRDYRLAAESLCAIQLPPLPREWSFSPGWTRYSKDGTAASVDCPGDFAALIFDVEICVKEGHFPTLATAASKDSWFSWCSSQLTREQFKWKEKVNLADLIPLERTAGSRSTPRVVVGHNVGFDRSFVRDQYFIQGSKLRFLDTLSLHMCVSGLTSLQRALSLANKSEKAAKDRDSNAEVWQDLSSLNNLRDVYALYSGGKVLKKEARETFVTGSLGDIAGNFQELMTYCANDVLATHHVLRKVLPLYFERFPHPISFSGMLEMATAYLPVNQNWERYLSDADAVYSDLQQELKQTLAGIANSACQLLHDDAYRKDPWLWDLNWSVQDMRCKKAPKKLPATKEVLEKSSMTDLEQQLTTEVKDILKTSEALYKTQPFLSGYPAWYRDFCVKVSDAEDADWEPGPTLISTQMRSVPKLLRLKWDGYPVHFDGKHGWGYLVPQLQADGSVVVPSISTVDLGADSAVGFPLSEFLEACGYKETRVDRGPRDVDSEWRQLGNIPEEGEAKLWRKLFRGRPRPPPPAGENLETEANIEGCRFFKLPHKDGPHKRVGNPLSKDFLNKVTDGVLQASDNPQANRVLSLSKIISYWKNARDRITSQMVVWFKKNELPKTISMQDGTEYGVILPRLIPAGTVTRRAVEPTWLTASNAYQDRLGSELKCMVQAPGGYHMVGADVDSQELWIAAILADAYFAGMHGSTAFGWMTLQGNKSAGTDMHSRTAVSVGITRDQAKIINYARIYGAGQPFAQRLLMQFNHRLTAKEALSKAKKMYAQTKGVRVDVSEEFGGQEVLIRGRRMVWKGGSESHMFNKLESIAHSQEPRTPVLGCRISRALEPAAVDANFFNSRINWVVQSSAVDYLHLMLVTMRWLMDDFAIRGRFAVSIHDEVRFLVVSEDRYRAALALQVTNLLTRSFFAWKLGMRDLPQSVAFFSSVEVDTVLRKEVDMDCTTPSNPHGLKKGYGISAGEALNIYEILEKTGGGCLSRSAKT